MSSTFPTKDPTLASVPKLSFGQGICGGADRMAPPWLAFPTFSLYDFARDSFSLRACNNACRVASNSRLF
eukprot:6288525-Lingulodinium_polyedra.AAC.1